MKNKLFWCLKTFLILFLVLINIKPLTIIADTGPIKSDISVIWPANNMFVGNGTEHDYSPTLLFSPEYLELEYIKSSGLEWINTRFIASHVNGFEIVFLLNPDLSGEWFHIIGGANAYDSKWHNGIDYTYHTKSGVNESVFKVCDGSHPNSEDSKSQSGMQKNVKYTVTYINGLFTDFNGWSFTSSKTVTTPQYEYYVFANNDHGTAGAFTPMRLYSLKMYTGTNVIKDFIPVVTIVDMPKDRNIDNTNAIPKGTVCLYDKKNDKYYLNSGSGNFTAGPYKNGLFGDKVHDFEAIVSISGLPEKYLDPKYVPIHIKNQETGGPAAGYYIYDTSTDTIWGDLDTSGASATSFGTGGSTNNELYKEVDTKKTDPDDYVAKVELIGLGKIYFNIPSDSTHEWTIKNRIIPTLTAYNGYYDGQEHTVTAYSAKNEDGNDITLDSIKFNTADDGNYPYAFSDVPKYTDVGTYRLFYKAEKQYYKPTTGYVDIVINPVPVSPSAKKKYKMPNTGVE